MALSKSQVPAVGKSGLSPHSIHNCFVSYPWPLKVICLYYRKFPTAIGNPFRVRFDDLNFPKSDLVLGF